ncbi:hypothetical protein [Klenkia brasiliensis]|uniref:hypothetical protein n=1 Tax=Klenkia brasiliensis TaxID=333142 RepID=UPI00104210D3|nr:hypothetical protein [Klenkia brasiliensis]
MGKHSALDGSTVHPLVADALQRRQHAAAPGRAPNVVQHQAADTRPTAVGWPDGPRRGDGLGWPGGEPAEAADRLPVHPDDDGSVLAVLDAAAEQDAEVPAPPVRRTGWRRFFGGGHSTSRPTTAA